MKFTVSPAPHVHAAQTTQRIMLAVITALMPCLAAAVYWFGPRALLVTGVSAASCVLFELLAELLAKRPLTINDLSAAVTGLILGLNLPVTAPWWLIVIGAAVAILLVKQLFGGIGYNFLNPALAARAVLLASWPGHLTNFTLPMTGGGTDAVSSATFLTGNYKAPMLDLFLGKIPGTMGEVCKLAILVGLLYLLLKRVITWDVPVSYLGSFVVLAFLFGYARDGFTGWADMLLLPVLSGGVLFGAVFMATDYVTNPMTTRGRLLYGVGCGLITAVIRYYGSYPEGVTYAILLMNIATPLIDRGFKPHVYGEVKQHA